jgi:lipoyl(octanoyl) transferase
VIRTLARYGVTGHRVRGAPGHLRAPGRPLRPRGAGATPGAGAAGDRPFAGLGKIAALGIKVSQHCTYHGVALNVAMDLEPFRASTPAVTPGCRRWTFLQSVSTTWDDGAGVLGRKLGTYALPSLNPPAPRP